MMKTLKEIFGEKTRGDGRRFRREGWDEGFWFEPIFKAYGEKWHGIIDSGFADVYREDEKFIEVKPTKKVKFYSPILGSEGAYHAKADWNMNKKYWDHIPKIDIKGWLEIDCEVEG
jgi:hypothetical protein